MNAIDPSALNNHKASSDRRPDPDFAQAVRDRSIVARLITPPGLKALLIAVTLALLNGLWIFAKGEGTSAAADLATSYALIMLFSLVFGVWLGVVFGVIFKNLVYHAIDDLERRIEKLLGGTIDCNTEDHDTAQTVNGRQVDYEGVFYFLLYLWSFPVLGFCLMFSILQGYAYADISPAVSKVVSPNIAISFVFLCISLTACIFLACWTWARILRARYRIGKLERQGSPATLVADMHALFPAEMSIADRISNAHRQTVRFVTGVF